MERDWGAMQCCTYAGELGPWVGTYHLQLLFELLFQFPVLSQQARDGARTHL